jgi:hypothetical protein
MIRSGSLGPHYQRLSLLDEKCREFSLSGPRNQTRGGSIDQTKVPNPTGQDGA